MRLRLFPQSASRNLVKTGRRFAMMATKPSTLAVTMRLEGISEAALKGNVDAVKRHCTQLEPIANLPSSVWEDNQIASALWRAYDVSRRWANGARDVNSRTVMEAVANALRLLNKSAK
jgi:hypothetical protein